MKQLLSDRPQQLAAGILLILLLLMLLMGMPGREVNIIKAYLWPATVALTAMMAFAVWKKPAPAAVLGVGMALWFLFCNVVNGDLYLQFNLRFVCTAWLTYGLCLPLMLVLDGEHREKWLMLFALCFSLFMLAISALSCYAALTGKSILLPASEGAIGITSNRLYALTKHPNELGCSMNIAMLCWLFLGMRARKPLCRVMCLLALVPLAFSIGLTASRTSIATAALVLGVAAAIALTAALRKSKIWLRWAAGAAALVLVASAALWALNAGVPLAMKNRATLVEGGLLIPTAYAEKKAPAKDTDDSELIRRDFTKGIGTFSLRTGIWEAGIRYIRENPSVLLVGSTDGQVSRIPGWILGRDVYHMHNSWLEMLLQTGVLGLAAYAFIIGRMLLAAARQVFCLSLPSWQRMLAAAPVVLLVCTLMEIYPCISGNVWDMMYMVLAGAVIAMDPKRKQAAVA